MSSILRALRKLRACVATSVGIAFLAIPAQALAQTETVEYYATDAIGSVRVVFDASGNVLGRMDYTPFGSELYTGLFIPTERFAQMSRDGESAQDYAEARMYQPRTGRFNAPDSVYAGLFAPQSWNRYAYGLNNPFRFLDPSGLQATPPNMPPEGCNNVGFRQEFADFCSSGGGLTGGHGSEDDLEGGNNDDQNGGTTSPTDTGADTEEPCVPPTDDGGGETTGEFLLSLTPVIGPGRAAINDFSEGSWGWGTVNGLMALSDVAVVKALATAAIKGVLIKVGGSHTHKATRDWMARRISIPKGHHAHHWLIKNNSKIGKMVPDWIKNQPWNYNILSPQMHRSVHGQGREAFGPLGRAYYGSPGWAKTVTISGAGRVANIARPCK